MLCLWCAGYSLQRAKQPKSASGAAKLCRFALSSFRWKHYLSALNSAYPRISQAAGAPSRAQLPDSRRPISEQVPADRNAQLQSLSQGQSIASGPFTGQDSRQQQQQQQQPSQFYQAHAQLASQPQLQQGGERDRYALAAPLSPQGPGHMQSSAYAAPQALQQQQRMASPAASWDYQAPYGGAAGQPGMPQQSGMYRGQASFRSSLGSQGQVPYGSQMLSYPGGQPYAQ